jgi:hypothetical protein
MSLGNCKLKQWAPPVHVFELLNSKTLIGPKANENMKQQKLSFIGGGNIKFRR